MLGLKLPTDPRWAHIAGKHIEEILTDHAYCEQKAASTSISLIVHFPEKTDLVSAMAALAQEEIGHFKAVHQKLIERGYRLGKPRSDAYVNRIMKFFPKAGSRDLQLLHRLLYAALIEARSCERFRLLSENIDDPDLVRFYSALMQSEAQHYTLFLGFARRYGGREAADEKWSALLDYEAEIMRDLGKEQSVHG